MRATDAASWSIAFLVLLVAGCSERAIEGWTAARDDFSGFAFPPDLTHVQPGDLSSVNADAAPVLDFGHGGPADLCVEDQAAPDAQSTGDLSGPDLSGPPPPIRFAAPIYEGGSDGQHVSLVVADFNRDGQPDIATTTDHLAVTLSLKRGAWQAPIVLPLTAEGHPTATADINRDGAPDLILLNAGAATVSILLGDGKGGFSNASTSKVGLMPADLLIADLDGNSKPDVITANSGDDTLSVLLGKGDGTFAAATTYKAHVKPSALAIGDFHGDGHQDVAASNQGSGDISILRGAGDGTLTAAIQLNAARRPGRLAAADFDLDGRTDLVASGSPDSIVFFFGDRNGLQSGSVTPVGGTPFNIATLDWDGDKKPDVAVGIQDHKGTDMVKPFIGDGNREFRAASPIPGDARSLVAADANGDLRPDILTGSYSGDVALFTNSGNGAFPRSTIPALSGRLSAQLADLDADGRLDLVGMGNGSEPFSTLLGLGDGYFLVGMRHPLGGGGIPVVADFNEDKKLDVVLAPPRFGLAGSTFLGNGDGTTKPEFGNGIAAEPRGRPTASDIDGDGHLDFLMVVDRMGLGVWRGSGDGSFRASVVYPAGQAPSDVAVGDWNGDGHPDAVVVNFDSRDISLFLNRGDGSLAKQQVFPIPAQAPFTSAPADFNSDGVLDLAVLCGDGKVSILLGKPGGGFAMGVNHMVTSNPNSLTTADLNGDARIDLAVAGDRVSISAGRGDGSFEAPTELALATHRSVSISAADLNRDGKPELLVTGQGGPWLTVLVNIGK